MSTSRSHDLFPHNRRERPRHGVFALLPVNIVDEQSRLGVACRVDDVSREGLGVISDQRFSVGQKLVLITLRERFKLEVTWCLKEYGRSEYRAGLRLLDEGKDLSDVFRSFFSDQQVG